MVDTPRDGAWCYTVNEPQPWAGCAVTCLDDPVLVARYSRLTPTQARMRASELVQGGNRVVTIRQNGESVAILSAMHGWKFMGRWMDPLYPARQDDPTEPVRLPITITAAERMKELRGS